MHIMSMLTFQDQLDILKLLPNLCLQIDPYCEFKKVDVLRFSCTPTINGVIFAGASETIMHNPNIVLFCGKNNVSSDWFSSTTAIQ